jgi:adenosylhomocysteine nucleosidase
LALNVVGIVCALASEARHLGPATRSHEPIGSLADGTLIAVTGMGGRAAAAGASSLIESGATALASWGMAGGLDPTLQAGAIQLPEEIVGIDGRVEPTAPQWRETLSAAIVHTSHLAVTGGRLLTSPHAIGSVADKAELFRTTGAAAVDMESLAVAEIARKAELPFVAVRVIVDSASDTLPRIVTAAADQEGHLQIWRLMSALALAPTQLAPLIRLARRYRAANRTLATVAHMGPWAPYAFPTRSDSRPT